MSDIPNRDLALGAALSNRDARPTVFEPAPKHTPAQLRATAADFVTRGTITREKADEMLRADGVEPLAANAPPTIDEFNLQPIVGQIPQSRKPGENATAVLGARDAAGAFLLASAIDKDAGNALVACVAQASRKTASLSSADRAAYAKKESGALQALWKGDFEKNTKEVQQYLSALGPAAGDWIRKNGGEDSAMVQFQIFNHLQALRARGAR